ncbi:hypothetical protein CERSUDRAFT_99022 [Gelatoporia subvermispora B]|uniref:Uncharacterized protein n=1 Tax=Ceriporiopsis subvermispora (strain B) TaxID=914234 RepID=M2R489_CERS8|nr:hypothetical protein CERSUDRAFT_99022 [Gelatoporia subvermispora B]
MILHDPSDFIAEEDVQTGKHSRPPIPPAVELADLSASTSTPTDTDRLVVSPTTPAPLPLKRTFRLQRYRGCAFGFLFAMLVGGLFRELQHILNVVERRNLQVISPDTPEPCISYAAWNLNPTYGNQHHFPHSAQTTFELPLDSELLYFIATGAENQLEGSIEIITSPNVSPHHASVEISAFYGIIDVLEWTRVCLLQRDQNKHGVGIFAAIHWPNRPRGYHAFFDIKVRLPVTGDSPLRINHLETDLPYFAHDVADLKGSIDFGTVSLNSKKFPILVHSLYAEHASISTYDAWISGSFETSSSLKIEGHGSTINANVTMLNDNSGVPTELHLLDASESIEATVNLTSTSPSRSGGAFKVNAATSGNKALNVTFPSAPLDVDLHVDARTWGAPITVSVPNTFEGTWSTRSSPDADLITDTNTVQPDPAGRGRTRNGLNRGVSPGVNEGTIYWGPVEDTRNYGEIRLTTFNAPAHLIFR